MIKALLFNDISQVAHVLNFYLLYKKFIISSLMERRPCKLGINLIM